MSIYSNQFDPIIFEMIQEVMVDYYKPGRDLYKKAVEVIKARNYDEFTMYKLTSAAMSYKRGDSASIVALDAIRRACLYRNREGGVMYGR